jgi:hypothetical protein
MSSAIFDYVKLSSTGISESIDMDIDKLIKYYILFVAVTGYTRQDIICDVSKMTIVFYVYARHIIGIE